jgi:aminoglycoside phosphotransferase (APT) family kinase protein
VPDTNDATLVARIADRAIPGHPLLACEPLPGGLTNGMYRVRLAGLADPLVVRIYRRDDGACRKEVELHRLVAAGVPVPEILHAACDLDGETPPHMVMRWVEGLTFREIKRRRDPREIAECARAIGAVLARIGAFTFPRPGEIGPGLAIGAPLVDSIPAFVETCLASPHFARRMTAYDRDRLRAYIARWEPEFAALAASRSLVHSDFGSPNLLLREIGGTWTVAAVLDWEFAFSGPPLIDVGHMMRYEHRDAPRIEPYFSTAFREHGGVLPENWRALSRALDLTALCEFLARPELPAEFLPGLLELAIATIEDRTASI